MGERVARPRPIPLVAFHRGLEPALAPIPGRGLERRGTPPDAPPAGGWGLGRRVAPDAPPADRRGLERREAPDAPPVIPCDYGYDYDYDDALYLGYRERYRGLERERRLEETEWGRQAREQREERLRQSRALEARAAMARREAAQLDALARERAWLWTGEQQLDAALDPLGEWPALEPLQPRQQQQTRLPALPAHSYRRAPPPTCEEEEERRDLRGPGTRDPLPFDRAGDLGGYGGPTEEQPRRTETQGPVRDQGDREERGREDRRRREEGRR